MKIAAVSAMRAAPTAVAIPIAAATTAYPMAINDSGVIVGVGLDASGHEIAFRTRM